MVGPARRDARGPRAAGGRRRVPARAGRVAATDSNGTVTVALRVGPSERDQRLDHLLADRLPDELRRPVSRSVVRRLVMAGAVERNGRVLRQPATVVQTGDRVRLVVDLARLGPTPAPVPALGERHLLHLDRWLVVVDKPPGVPTHATVDPDRPHLVAMTRELLDRRPLPGGSPAAAPVRLGIHHRLDRDTSGPVLFTLDPTIDAAVGRLFAERLVDKRYWALCTSPVEPPGYWEVRNHLGAIDRTGRRNRYGSVRSGGSPAHTELRRLGPAGPASDGVWLIEARPHTGRTHQVRVHLAEAGLPIVGDDLYGGRPGPQVQLHCRRLAFTHPVTGDVVDVRSEPPAALARAAAAALPPAERSPSRPQPTH